MKRYAIKQISANWYCIIDLVKKEVVAESTSIGIKLYADLLGID